MHPECVTAAAVRYIGPEDFRCGVEQSGRDEAVTGRVDAEFIEVACDASLLGEPTRGGAQMVDPATDSGEIRLPGSVMEGHLASKPDHRFVARPFGDRTREPVGASTRA